MIVGVADTQVKHHPPKQLGKLARSIIGKESNRLGRFRIIARLTI